MKRIWFDPPHWDSHLDEAIEEVNAMGLGDCGLVAVKREPREPDPNPYLWPVTAAALVLAGCMMALLINLVVAVYRGSESSIEAHESEAKVSQCGTPGVPVVLGPAVTGRPATGDWAFAWTGGFAEPHAAHLGLVGLANGAQTHLVVLMSDYSLDAKRYVLCWIGDVTKCQTSGVAIDEHVDHRYELKGNDGVASASVDGKQVATLHLDDMANETMWPVQLVMRGCDARIAAIEAAARLTPR